MAGEMAGQAREGREARSGLRGLHVRVPGTFVFRKSTTFLVEMGLKNGREGNKEVVRPSSKEMMVARPRGEAGQRSGGRPEGCRE